MAALKQMGLNVLLRSKPIISATRSKLMDRADGYSFLHA
jgi:hypothetical protein